jgi:hypothetical protein
LGRADPEVYCDPPKAYVGEKPHEQGILEALTQVLIGQTQTKRPRIVQGYLEVLDAQREQASRSLGSGHYVVFRVAGSGKTAMLLARARLIPGRDPGKKVLVLCYNKALAALLAAQLDVPGLDGS